MKKNKLQENNNIIEEKIKEQIGWNKARIFIIVALVIAIIKLERVNLKKFSVVVIFQRFLLFYIRLYLHIIVGYLNQIPF